MSSLKSWLVSKGLCFADSGNYFVEYCENEPLTNLISQYSTKSFPLSATHKPLLTSQDFNEDKLFGAFLEQYLKQTTAVQVIIPTL